MEKPKPKRHKKTERQLIEKRLDDLVREIVLLRDPACVCCGSEYRGQPGHLISRRKHVIRWDLYNVNRQCAGCNLQHNYSPHRYTNWLLSRYGIEKYQELCIRADCGGKYSINELEDLEFDLKCTLQRMKGELEDEQR